MCFLEITFSTGLFSDAMLVFWGVVVLKCLFVTNFLPQKNVPEQRVMDDIFPYPSLPQNPQILVMGCIKACK